MTESKNSKKVSAADPRTHLELLCKNGMWPYLPGREAALEPSVWAAIACRNNSNLRQAFLAGVLSLQNADGGWSSYQGASRSDWTTGVVLLGLRIISSPEQDPKISDAFKRGIEFLIDNRADHYSGIVKAAYLLWKGPRYSYARGWPWTPETFDWIEPTAYVVLALHGSQYAKGKLADALSDAQDFLLESYCYPGGWDCADRTPVERKAADAREGPHFPYPYPSNTGLALLALQSQKTGPVIEKGLEYLTGPDPDRQSVLGLAWSAVVLHAFDRPIDKPMAKLMTMKKEDGTFGSETMTNALVSIALALTSEGNPLKAPLSGNM